jgi:hypothetical protein
VRDRFTLDIADVLILNLLIAAAHFQGCVLRIYTGSCIPSHAGPFIPFRFLLPVPVKPAMCIMERSPQDRPPRTEGQGLEEITPAK